MSLRLTAAGRLAYRHPGHPRINKLWHRDHGGRAHFKRCREPNTAVAFKRDGFLHNDPLGRLSRARDTIRDGSSSYHHLADDTTSVKMDPNSIPPPPASPTELPAGLPPVDEKGNPWPPYRDISNVVVITVVTLCALSTVVIALRVYVRVWMTRVGLGSDDIFMLAGMVSLQLVVHVHKPASALTQL